MVVPSRGFRRGACQGSGASQSRAPAPSSSHGTAADRVPLRQEIAALPCVDAIWLFGSRARGYARARSDIDLAVL
jgi:hypothetical protein